MQKLTKIATIKHIMYVIIATFSVASCPPLYRPNAGALVAHPSDLVLTHLKGDCQDAHVHLQSIYRDQIPLMDLARRIGHHSDS